MCIKSGGNDFVGDYFYNLVSCTNDAYWTILDKVTIIFENE